MTEFVFNAEAEADTERLGKALASLLPDGSTVLLSGTLGAGKTRLVRAFAVACGVPAERVLSPTFVICHEYQTEGKRIFHFDAYRVADSDEFLQLGPEEYFESDGISFVEWGERVGECLPADRLEIHITVAGEQSRRFKFLAHTAPHQAMLAELSRRLND